MSINNGNITGYIKPPQLVSVYVGTKVPLGCQEGQVLNFLDTYRLPNTCNKQDVKNYFDKTCTGKRQCDAKHSGMGCPRDNVMIKYYCANPPKITSKETEQKEHPVCSSINNLYNDIGNICIQNLSDKTDTTSTNLCPKLGTLFKQANQTCSKNFDTTYAEETKNYDYIFFIIISVLILMLLLFVIMTIYYRKKSLFLI